MGNLRRKTVGEKFFSGKVRITDPCYDRNAIDYQTCEVVPGTYKCLVWNYSAHIGPGNAVTKRIGNIGIYLNGEVPMQNSMEKIGWIGVDAGLAGFFMDKPDYTDEEWDVFCDSLKNQMYWIRKEGFFSESGYGDGSYPVYAKYDEETGKAVALEIRFL